MDSSSSEVAVLSILMKDPDLLETIELSKGAFSTETFGEIFKLMEDVKGENLVPDYSLLLSKISANPVLEKQTGGRDVLEYIYTEVYSKDNLPEYVKQIRDSHRFKELLKLSTQINVNLKSGNSPDLVLADVENSLQSLRDNEGIENSSDIGEIARSAWDQLEKRLNNPGLPGVTTGLRDLDLVTGGYQPGKLWVVAGRPGQGKSAMMCHSAIKAAEELKARGNNEHVIIFSLEMTREELAYRMISSIKEVSLQSILFGTLTQAELNKVQDGFKYLASLPIILDATPSTDERRFTSVVRKHNRTRKIAVGYLDYIQLGTERDEGQTMALGRFTRAGKILAKELGACFVFYSQLNRQVEMREDKHPVLSDLRQSGNIEEDADIVTFLYREYMYKKDTKYPNRLEVCLEKHRNGVTGVISAEFHGEYMQIKDEN